jgi:hypothetical protein
MDSKSRGWLNIIGGIVAGYFAYSGNSLWSLYVLALLFLLSGWHHMSHKGK